MGSGTVVVVVDEDAVELANLMKGVPADGVHDDEVAVLVAEDDEAAAALGLSVSPVPVCTVTNAPGVTSDGL